MAWNRIGVVAAALWLVVMGGATMAQEAAPAEEAQLQPGDKLIQALRMMIAGEVYAPADLMRPSGTTDGLKIVGAEVLTPRELEVAAMLVKGASNKEIARALDLQEVTVKLHVRNLCRKLETKNRTQIAVRLAQLGQFM